MRKRTMMMKRRMTMNSNRFENIDEVLSYKASLKKKVKRKEKKFKKTFQLVGNGRNSSNSLLNILNFSNKSTNDDDNISVREVIICCVAGYYIISKIVKKLRINKVIKDSSQK